MKNIFYILLAGLTLGITGCSKDDANNGAANNTWSFKPDGKSAIVYHTKTTSLSVQGFQVFEATSEPDAGDATPATLKFYFKNVNPPPTGTYKVVDYEDLENEDEVAIYGQMVGNAQLGGGNQHYFFSHNDAGHTISYTFENGKVSLKCNAVPMYQTGAGVQRGELTANISQ